MRTAMAGSLILILAATSAQARGPIRPTHDPATLRVAASVERLGARRYFAALGDGDANWKGFLSAVERAEPGALTLAVRLRPSMDAGNAEALGQAAARGLPVAPLPVLALTRSGFTVEQVCTSPFIEPEAGVEQAYNRRALRTLDAIPAAARPQPVFARCRAALTKIARSF